MRATRIRIVAAAVVVVQLAGLARVAADAPVEPGPSSTPVAPVALPPPPPPPPAELASAPTPAPPPATPPPAVAAPPAMTLEERLDAAYDAAVPARWQALLPVLLRAVEGATSFATEPDLVEVGRAHLEGRWERLVSVVAHEFAHLIAFAHGSWAFVGAAPEGWPDPGYSHPAESWADCVAQAFTGIVDPSYDMPPCPDVTVAWTASWLATFAG